MKKTACIALLMAISWLTTYQICDAAEDAIQDFRTHFEVTLGRGLALNSPTASSEEADRAIPAVVGRALAPQTLTLNASAEPAANFLFSVAAANVALPVESLSPPGSRLSGLSRKVLACSNQCFVLSVRSLAPPVV